MCQKYQRMRRKTGDEMGRFKKKKDEMRNKMRKTLNERKKKREEINLPK